MEQRIDPYNMNQESDHLIDEYLLNDIRDDNNSLDMYIEHLPPSEDISNLAIGSEYVDVELCDSTQAAQQVDEVKHNINSVSPTGKLPCMDNYPGPYDFEILLEETTSHKRSWVYSHKLNKVFIDMEKMLLIQFRLSTVVSGMRVRAMPVYTTSDYINQPVNRCPLHAVTLDPQHLAHEDGNCFCVQYQWVGHVLQTVHSNVQYEYDVQSGRHSVVVPLETPQAGSDTCIIPYQFTCKTSCLRGMQRRPINVIFTLETPQGEVVGRRSLSVKICSCPKRDKEREEHDMMSQKSLTVATRSNGKRKMAAESKSTSKKMRIGNPQDLAHTSEVPSNRRGKSTKTSTKGKIEEMNALVERLHEEVAHHLKEIKHHTKEMESKLAQIQNINVQRQYKIDVAAQGIS